MKKNLIFMIIGMIIMGSIVFAADLLADAKSISYSSEYTEKDNVADALTELLSVEPISIIKQEATTDRTGSNPYSLNFKFTAPEGNNYTKGYAFISLTETYNSNHVFGSSGDVLESINCNKDKIFPLSGSDYRTGATCVFELNANENREFTISLLNNSNGTADHIGYAVFY